MSSPGSPSSFPRRRHEPSGAVTGLVLKRLPGGENELLNPTRGFDPVYFDATANVHAKWSDLSNRGADIVRVQTPGEQERECSANLFRALPIGTSACPSWHSLGVSVNEDSHRRRRARSVAIDLGQDVYRVDSRSRSKCLKHRHRQFLHRLRRLRAVKLDRVDV